MPHRDRPEDQTQLNAGDTTSSTSVTTFGLDLITLRAGSVELALARDLIAPVAREEQLVGDRNGQRQARHAHV
jgi:hypothetical protein